MANYSLVIAKHTKLISAVFLLRESIRAILTAEQLTLKFIKMANLKTTWDFVQKYYPDYDYCDEIANNNFLSSIVNRSEQEGSCAEEMLNNLMENHQCDETTARMFAEDFLKESDRIVHERAIEGFILQQNQQ